MGCVSSQPASSKPRATPTGGPRPGLKPKPARCPPSASSGDRALSSTITYDSTSSASLSTDGSDAPVAFYGILAGGGTAKLSLANRPSNAAPDRRRSPAVHPADDSTAPAALAPESGDAVPLVALRGFAMTLPYTILVGGLGAGAEARVRSVVDGVFAKVNAHLNVWNPDSDIAALNEAPPMKAVPVSPLLADVFGIVDRLHDVSGGRFDPTAAVLTLAWTRSIAEHSRPPLPADVAHLRHAIGWPAKVKRKDTSQAARGNGNTVVDIDGVAKGHAVDLLFDVLCKSVAALSGGGGGADSPAVYVDWAGDIRASGRHPAEGARPWRTAVMRPPGLQDLFKIWAEGKLHSCLAGAEPVCVLDLLCPAELEEERGGERDRRRVSSRADSFCSAVRGVTPRRGVAIATSGDYFHMQKFGFHHVANPVERSVMKAGAISVASVSVIAATCAIADGLATAAMTFAKPQDAVDFLEALVQRLPDEVYGFAVAGRTPEHGTEVFTSPYFDRCSVSSAPSETPETLAEAMPAAVVAAAAPLQSLSERETSLILSRCPRIPCLLKFENENVAIQIDSLQSLSMDTEPCVSFIFPTPLKSSFGLDAGKSVISFTVGQEEGTSRVEPASLSLQVVKVLPGDDVVSVAIAAVCGASQGVASTIGLNYSSHTVSYSLTRAVEPLIFAQMSIVDQAKAVLRRVPGVIWIVTTEAAHGGKHGVTASSVASSVSAPGVVSFNIMNSNMFTAAFRGVGSSVEIFGLDASQEHLASKFVEKSTMTAGDFEGLRRGANICMVVNIMKVAVVTDHMLAVGNVLSASSQTAHSETSKSPLLWLDRRYERLTL
jgi:FAD:protein FMN transferase